MSVRRHRKSFSKPQRPRFQFESLEPRQMLSGNPVVIPIVSGTTYTFKDGDGTTVKVKLSGGGSGQMTLTNGLANGGAIDTLSITGTNANSQLKITAAGGADDVSTINALTVGQNPGSTPILSQFTASSLNVAGSGVLQFNGTVGGLSLTNVGASASVNVTGGVTGQFVAQQLSANSSISVTGVLAALNVQTINPGVNIAAGTLTKLNVGSTMTSASVYAGAGGMQSVYLQNAVNSNIWTAGSIGSLQIQASSSGSSVVANRNPGSDGVFGTMDDFTISSSSAGTIGPVTLSGAVGVGASTLQLIATGTIGTVTVPNGQPQPEVVDDAISQFIPLEIAQAVADATGFEDDEVWIGIYGEESIIAPSGQSAPAGVTYFLDASQQNSGGAAQPTPIPISTATLNVGLNTPDLAILPSSTIAAWANASSQWGSNLQLPIPAPGYQFSGRIIISVGAPVQAQVVASTGAVSAPSASSATDPSTGTFYDFLEFTVTNSGGVPNLDIDTSQVDAFGLPMTLQFFEDVQAQHAIDIDFTGTATNGSKTITNVSPMTGLAVGQVISGTGIPTGAIIDSVSVANSTITLSLPAGPSASGAPASLAALIGGPVGVEGTRSEITYGPDPSSLQTFLNNQVSTGNTGARPFLQSATPFVNVGGTPIVGATSSGQLVVYTDSTVGLQDNDQVVISGVQGTTNANGVFTISAITANSFQLNSTTSNGAYVSGGTWSFAITGASNPGVNQDIVITATNIGTLQNGDYVEITGVTGNANANGFFQVSNVTSTTFTLVDSDGSGGAYASGGSWRIYGSGPRIVSPKDVVELLIEGAASPNQLNNYFNEAIDDFFLQYLPANETNAEGTHGGGSTFTIESQASGSSLTYTGTVKNLGSEFGYGLFLTTPTSNLPFLVFYPFTQSNTPSDYTPKFSTVAAQPWMTQPDESASLMVFACDGFFADNSDRAKYYNVPSTSTWSKVLGDLENSIVTAFNRGIALNSPSTWGDRSTWFQQNNGQNGQYNYWVQYWHESGLAVNDLAYAFPYDDKYGSSTNLSANSVGLARVLLNQWSTTQQTTTATFSAFPASAQQDGPITLTANVATAAIAHPLTGTVTFFIDGVAINSNDFGSSPPQQPVAIDGSGNATLNATLPALSNGSTTHTYTVTAVYSGDQYHAPSIAYQSLETIGVNGDFLMTVNPDQAPLGTANVNVSATLPGPMFDGTVALSISRSDGTGSQVLSTTNVTSANWSTNVTIPSNLLTFTGDLTNNQSKIENVSSVVDLLQEQTLTTSYFTGSTKIKQIQPPGLTLSVAALKTGTVTFSSNGVQFTGTVTEGQTALTGVNTLAGLTTTVSITQVTGNSELLAPNTTVDALVPGWVELYGTANTTQNGVSFASDGAGAVFPLIATFTPTSGGPYVANMGFQGPVLP